MTFHFDPYSDEFQADPYRYFDDMRRRAPVHYDETWDLTFFTRYRDVNALLRDRRFGRNALHVMEESELRHASPVLRRYPSWTRFNRTLGFIDLEPPEHTRLRGLVSRVFTRSRAARLRTRVEAVARAALDNGGGKLEVVGGYATPIPLTMISELLGIPAGDRPRLIAWSHAIVRLYELRPTDDGGAEAERATIEFVEYLRDVVALRRRTPGDDLLSDLIHVEEQGDRLTEDELIATAILILNAGHEATVHAIGNAVLALAAHPDQFRMVRANPILARSAAEELLRYDTPLQMFERWVLSDVDWDGIRLRKGTKVGLLMGAANRDPDRFPNADQVDVTRTDNPHVSFGAGIHHCLGAPLARIELEVALAELARRLPELTLTAPPLRHDSFIFRGVTELQIAV